jgi:predicted transcriptional regulator
MVDDLARTLHSRSDLLALLVEEPLSKRAIEERVDTSRSTVDRGIRDLEAVGLVERTNGGYAATPSGRLAAESRAAHVAELDGMDRAKPLLGVLDDDGDELDRRMLAGVEVERAEPPSTFAPLERLKDVIRHSDRYVGVSGNDTGTGFGEFFHEQVVEEGLDLSFVFTREMADHLETRLSTEIPEMRAEGFEMGVVDQVPFGLGVGTADDWAMAAVLVYGPSSRLAGILFNENPAAVEWATGLFDRYSARAETRPP